MQSAADRSFHLLMTLKKMRSLVFSIVCFALVMQVVAQKQRIVVHATDVLIDGTTAPYNQVKPGDTLFFAGGTRGHMLIRNFSGEPGNPVIFTNLDSAVVIDSDYHYGISIQNCRYFRFTGTGTLNNFYGFNVKRVLGGAGIGIGSMSSDYEIDHFSIANVPVAGIYAKTDPDCSFTSTREKFTQYNTIIHDNYIGEAGNEGLYIGSSKYLGQVVNCNGIDTLLYPSILDGVEIYSNIISYSGWDGIQVSSGTVFCRRITGYRRGYWRI